MKPWKVCLILLAVFVTATIARSMYEQSMGDPMLFASLLVRSLSRWAFLGVLWYYIWGVETKI